MTKLSTNRDYQRKRVYRWEDEATCWSNHDRLTLDQCQAMIRQVFIAYGLSPPRVTDGRGRRSACGGAGRIAIPHFSRTRVIVLHESAHALLARMGRYDAHGPLFVRTYIELLVGFDGWSRGALERSAAERGIDVAPAAPIHPRHPDRVARLQLPPATKPKRKPDPHRKARQEGRRLIAGTTIEVEKDSCGVGLLVWPPGDWSDDETWEDPADGDHLRADWGDALPLLREYAARADALGQRKPK
jgi:hypothetical protein